MVTREESHDRPHAVQHGDLVLLRSGRRDHLVRAGEGTLHTERGMVDLAALAGVPWGGAVCSHLGTDFVVLSPRAPDFFRHFRRVGAPMMPQDVGLVVALTGLGKRDAVLEAGTGSGVLACYLGMVAGSVESFEVRPEAARVARENIALAGLDNVHVVEGDLAEALPRLTEAGRRFDVAVLDLGGAEALVPAVRRVLTPGGCLACYSPFVEQMAAVHRAMEGVGFVGVFSAEVILREQQVGPRGVRPATRVGHTGFLTVGRSTTGGG